MKKRIAMISYHTCPLASEEGKETGGMNVYVLELSKKLAEAGYAVDIFTRSQDAQNIPVVDVSAGLRVIHVKAGPQRPVHKKSLVPFLPEFVDNCAAFAKADGVSYDAVHAHYYLSGLIGLELKKTHMAPGPLLLTFHTLALMKNLVARDESEKEDDFRVQSEFDLAEKADHVIATGPYDAQYVEYLFSVPRGKISVVPPGVDFSVFHPVPVADAKKNIGIPDTQRVVLFVGRIEPLKGIDMLLYASKILVTRNPDLPVTVCIVGGDISKPQVSWSKTLQSLNQIQQTLHLPVVVKFVGQKHQDELSYYYNSADVVVMPSHYEAFGMAALEAMACGVPVITTDATGIAGLIDEKHASLITSVNNPLLLATQIEHVLNNPEKRQEIGTQNRERIADLTWDAAARKTAAIYTSLRI